MKALLSLKNLFGRKKLNNYKRKSGYNDAKKQRFAGFGHGGSGRDQNDQAIFIPERKLKFKGYMRNNRTWGRKKKAA